MTKKILTYAGIVLFFLVLAYAFVPQVLTGKIVNQSDISGYTGMVHEASEWNKAHPDDEAYWTGSMFSGMPTVMLTGNPHGDWTRMLYKALLIGKRPASYLFLSMTGAFLLLLALGISPVIAAGGAIAVTFCSYNFQIIQVGHNTKMQALAFLPWVLAGVIFTYRSAFGLYRKKEVPQGKAGKSGRKSWLLATVLGAVLFALALDFQIKADHVQISYYLAIIIIFYVIALFIWVCCRRRELTGRFFVASALLLVLGIVGIGTNANKLIPTFSYSKQTMRGGSELTQDDGGKSKGLDLDYATAWSYGWNELPNTLIPNYNGGASSQEVNPDKSATIRLLKQAGQTNTRQLARTLPLYWGPQPFTAGPMYMGAITVFLFILGLCLYRGKEKWWILAATVIGIFLALGSHFMPFTKFWYNHMPFYSKFRTVSMALVILQFTLPMLAFLVLDRIMKGEYDKKSFMKAGWIAVIVTGGFCLISATGMGRSFVAATDASQPDILVEAFARDRMMLLRHDALISAVLIVLSFVLLVWAYNAKDTSTGSGRKNIAGIAVCVLVLLNMWSVGKRYLNSEHFTTPRQFNNQFATRQVDNEILKDKSPSYRVLDLTVNVFNSSQPSYWHKNIGGYSPVKLQRYQDLMDYYLTPEINSLYAVLRRAETVADVYEQMPELPVLSMLNDKYIIVGAENAPVMNFNALGNCWFVDSAVEAENADMEISLLGAVDLTAMAIVREGIVPESMLYNDTDEESTPAEPGDDVIELVSYTPNTLVYHYSAVTERLAVFSEIYYPTGWTATLEDGTAIDIFQTDWVLRGAVLPAGEHDIVMSFNPPSYRLGTALSRASSILLILLLLGSIGGMVCSGKEDEYTKSVRTRVARPMLF